jgi:CheY-like chemotaxis protein
MPNKIEKLPKVLVIDDDAEMAYLAQYLLQQCGYASDSAMDTRSFRQSYAEVPTVVMLDLTMPNSASEDITEIMAQLHAKHPIIFITGSQPEEIEHRRQQAEAKGLKITAVLRKPFWIEDIVKVMAAAMASLEN